ncbi:MAG: septal ring factor EnvC (AmiA/AmiB activator) [Candidatus Azotimanducaceae bacterium]|jgi:septal ring factor EnvC (AmiA/AmiB activator)
MKARFFTALALGFALAPFLLTAQNSVSETRDILEQWVQTRQIISKEQADWKTEQSILKDTVNLLSRELERLEKTLEDLEASATAADEDRTKLAAEKEELSAASAVVEGTIGALETQLKQIIETLPEPLINKIKPLIRRLPDDPEDTKLSLGERVQNIVGILSQADKFNTTITQTSESRELESGKIVEVRTLYWGLAMAYYVDASATYAGIGFPGTAGWEWPQVEGKGLEIKRLIDVYEGTEDIQFVEVPARIN